jgi:hypothetical protein
MKAPNPTVIALCRQELLAWVSHRHAACLVAAYYDPTGPFAGSTFDDFATGPANEITAGDLLAVSFLDVQYPVLAVRRITSAHDELEALLRAIDANVDLWDADDASLDAAEALWTWLRTNLHGVDSVLAGKLLARKRPRMIPIVDRWTIHAVPSVPDGEIWSTFRAALDPNLIARIETLRGPNSADTSTLRLLDAAIWMQHSNSTNAGNARKACGCAVDVASCTD